MGLPQTSWRIAHSLGTEHNLVIPWQGTNGGDYLSSYPVVKGDFVAKKNMLTSATGHHQSPEKLPVHWRPLYPLLDHCLQPCHLALLSLFEGQDYTTS